MWRNELFIHRVFNISLILKGIFSVLEIVGGLLVLYLNQQFILNLILSITANELSIDPDDFFANYLIHSAQQFSLSSQYFIAIYLLIHGIIKGLLIITLFKEKLWSYPLAMIIFSLFSGYQIYEFIRTGSIWLLVLTVLDVFIIALAWHEYRYMQRTGLRPKWGSK